MDTSPLTAARLSRRAVLAAGGAALLSGAGLLAGAPPADAAETLLWNAWGPLAGYGISAECNPGGGSFPCDPREELSTDVKIEHFSGYTEVTANPSRTEPTFVNAIGRRKFPDNAELGKLQLALYHYVYAIRLPRVPDGASPPWAAEQTHQMIQFWDGSNQLWTTANKRTLEAASFWKLNPSRSDYGKIFVYSRDGNDNLTIVDTGITLPPDTNWHVFELQADLANQAYGWIAVDGQGKSLTNVPLARRSHPDWGNDLTLIFTAESENAWPGSPPQVTRWTTQFKDPKIFRNG